MCNFSKKTISLHRVSYQHNENKVNDYTIQKEAKIYNMIMKTKYYAYE